MKKKFLALALSVFATASITAGVFLATKDKVEVDSSNYQYTMTLDKDNQIELVEALNSENYNIGKVRTDIGSEISINYSMSLNIDPSDSFAIFEDEQYIELRVPINGLTRMDYSINNSMTISVGYKKQEYRFETDLENTDGEIRSLDFIDLSKDVGILPSYFIITADISASSHIPLNIKFLKFYYTCVASPDPSKEVGHWTTIPNEEGGGGLTITGFSIDPSEIPANKTLIVPNEIGTDFVMKIEEGVLNNIPWVEHIVVPFVGNKRLLNQENTSYNFGAIFGKNSAHYQYQPMQQYEGNKSTVWYIPKALKAITVSWGNVNIDDLTNFTIPDYGLYGLVPSIQSISLGGTVKKIGQFAFANSANLDGIVLPSTVSSVGNNAFIGCNSLIIRSLSTEAVINDAANPNYRPVSTGYQTTFTKDHIIYDICSTSSSNYYLNVVGLNKGTKIANIPASATYGSATYNVKKIANRAFENHTELRAIHIDESIEQVGHYAFYNCPRASLYVVNEPDSKYLSEWNIGLGGSVYINYDSYNEETYNYYQTANEYYIFDVVDKDATEIDLRGFNDKTLVLPEYAFDGNDKIVTIYLPNDIVIKPYAFSKLMHLEEANYDGTMDEFTTLKEAGKVGFNCFLKSNINTIHCSDGWVSFD